MALRFPAYAGVILLACRGKSRAKLFPRSRGGDPWRRSLKLGDQVLFPAHAGVIPRNTGKALPQVSFPRPRGGDPSPSPGTVCLYAFSPPTRG